MRWASTSARCCLRWPRSAASSAGWKCIGDARRHHGLRRFRAPPDRDRDHARRPARDASATRGSSWRWNRAATRCAWARMPTRWRLRWTAPTRWCSCIGPELAWDAGKVVGALRGEGVTAPDVDALIDALRTRVRRGDHVVFMSNGGFDGAPRRFLAAATTAAAAERVAMPRTRVMIRCDASPTTARAVSAAHRAVARRDAGAARVRTRATSTWSANARVTARGFGVCLILDRRRSRPACDAGGIRHARRGSRISRTGDDGLLHLRVRGGRRFHVHRDTGARQRPAGRRRRVVRPGSGRRGAPGARACWHVLQQIVEQVGGEQAKAPPARFDDAAWVGWRLAELLPLQESQRQALLQIDDPHARSGSVAAPCIPDCTEGGTCERSRTPQHRVPTMPDAALPRLRSQPSAILHARAHGRWPSFAHRAARAEELQRPRHGAASACCRSTAAGHRASCSRRGPQAQRDCISSVQPSRNNNSVSGAAVERGRQHRLLVRGRRSSSSRPSVCDPARLRLHAPALRLQARAQRFQRTGELHVQRPAATRCRVSLRCAGRLAQSLLPPVRPWSSTMVGGGGCELAPAARRSLRGACHSAADREHAVEQPSASGRIQNERATWRR